MAQTNMTNDRARSVTFGAKSHAQAVCCPVFLADPVQNMTTLAQPWSHMVCFSYSYLDQGIDPQYVSQVVQADPDSTEAPTHNFKYRSTAYDGGTRFGDWTTPRERQSKVQTA
jgi:hypothetical protein